MEVRAWTLLGELAARIPSVREPIASLSGGQRQTVAIARSLLLDPKIIMLDEPTAALGVAQTAEVLNLIERLRDRGLGVIMISHNMEDVRAVADRIVVLRLGRNNGVFTAGRLERTSWSAPSPARPTTPSRGAPPGARPRPRRRTGHERQADHGPLLDRSDSRVTHAEGIAGAVSAFLDRVRSGDLGSLPVIVGLVIIWTVFYSLNPIFLSPNNMVNLLFDCSIDRGDRARHRLRAAARRDRPLRRLDERRRLGADRRALGEPGLAAPRRHRRRARGRRLRRRDLRAAAHPAQRCRASSRRCRACSRCSGCSSTCSGRPARSTSPTARRSSSFRPAPGDAGLAVARAGADPRHRDARASGCAPWSSAARRTCRPARSARSSSRRWR